MTLTHTLRLLSACSLLLAAGCSPLELEEGSDSPPVDTTGVSSPGVNGNSGNSEPQSFLTVTEALKEETGTVVTVVGYYVGFVDGNSLENIGFCVNNAGENSNMLLCDDLIQYDVEKCIPIALPSGSKIRRELNTFSHPELHQKRLLVTGELTLYFGVNGIKSPKQWRVLNDDELLPNPEPKPNPNPDPNPGQTLPQINPSAAPCLRAL